MNIKNRVEKFMLGVLGQSLTHKYEDVECEAYFGWNLHIGKFRFKYRKSKITPKKAGQFVTLWKRDAALQTIPFDESDPYDYYIIASEQDDKEGFFLFPKWVLAEKHYITPPTKEGKRGFRVYPTWTITDNKQAEKTQSWQSNYFIDLKGQDEEKAASILS